MSSPVAPASVPANLAAAPVEQQLLQTLQSAKAALAGAQLKKASELMQTANELCEAALRDPASVSRTGLAEIQQLYADCLETGKPLQDALALRMNETGTVAKAAKAYRPRRGPR